MERSHLMRAGIGRRVIRFAVAVFGFATLFAAASVASAGDDAPSRSNRASDAASRAVPTELRLSAALIATESVADPLDLRRQNRFASADSREAPPRLTVHEFWDDLTSDLWRDFKSVWTRENLAILGVAGAASAIVHNNLDERVAENTRHNPNRWGRFDDVLGGFGNPSHHFAVAGALYFYSLHEQDAELHDFSKTLLDALAVTGASTVLLKAVAGTGTRAPSREADPFGGAWPSGHTSSSFAVAAVLNEYCGAKVGIPAYLLAGLVGWERIDDREHDLSDVFFGAALGYVIGKTIAANHHSRVCGMELVPLVDAPSGASGLALERRF